MLQVDSYIVTQHIISHISAPLFPASAPTGLYTLGCSSFDNDLLSNKIVFIELTDREREEVSLAKSPKGCSLYVKISSLKYKNSNWSLELTMSDANADESGMLKQ